MPHTTRASVGWCYRTYIFSLIFAAQKSNKNPVRDAPIKSVVEGGGGEVKSA
ncbi:hypothetical protein [uncultured Helicobacter sp.]|uniref:hypothetical protein n=1 Tax=uncultured Helicobacter sp. TaxID=175537 RepID=UPI003753C0F0